MEIRTHIERWPLSRPFRITGHTMSEAEVLVVTLHDAGLTGRGEASGVYYRHEHPRDLQAQVEGLRGRLQPDGTRAGLQALLPIGGARNALDCALWDLESQRAGKSVWQLAGLRSAPQSLLTTFTLGADDPDVLAARAREATDMRALKLKLTGEPIDAERVRAVRAARPDVWLGVDANQGFTLRSLEKLLPELMDARVELIEQPFPIGRESDLDGLDTPIAIAADESVQDAGDLAALENRFDVVNIKLDKCGGLTAALDMAQEARRRGFKLMVGNMVGTSLAMAPAFIVGQACEIVDLDGPLLLASDRVPGASYRDGRIWCGEEVWGGVAPTARPAPREDLR